MIKDIEELINKKREILLLIFDDRFQLSFKKDVDSRFTKFPTSNLEVGEYHEDMIALLDEVKELCPGHDETFSEFLKELKDLIEGEFNTEQVEDVISSFNYTL
jgi:hypothetical protein